MDLTPPPRGNQALNGRVHVNKLDAGRTERPRPAGRDSGGPSGACEGPLRSTSATRQRAESAASDRFSSRCCSPRRSWPSCAGERSPTVWASSSAQSSSIRPRRAVPASVDSTSVARPSLGSGRRRTNPARSRRCTVRVIDAESVPNSDARSAWRCGPASHKCISSSSCPGCSPTRCSR
jgi:hypothetical protein